MNQPVPDEVVLGLLKAEPMHGYRLLEKFRSKDELGRVWTMSTSQLYAVLRRLEEAGKIKGKEIPVSDAPSKVVYSVSSHGIDTLENWLYDENPPSSIHLIRVTFLSRLYVASTLGYDVNLIIVNQKKVCKEQLEFFLTEREKQLSEIEKLTIDFIIGQLEAAIKWLTVAKLPGIQQKQNDNSNNEDGKL